MKTELHFLLFQVKKDDISRTDTEESMKLWILTLGCRRNICHLYLAFLVHQTLQHLLWGCKLVWIPGEVALPVSVLDVEPDEVIGDVVLVKACVHLLHVLLVVVVPAALMVAQSREGRERLGA